jgi:D-glycero-alpha-D-manno-heptose-7-phosphate kinase
MTENRPVLRKMVKLAEDLRDELNNDSIDHVGDILDAGWHYKKELCKSISNGAVDFWYNKAKESGATGGKLLGAGSTGFMLLYVPGDKNIICANMDLYELKFKFEDTGTSIIYQ